MGFSTCNTQYGSQKDANTFAPAVCSATNSVCANSADSNKNRFAILAGTVLLAVSVLFFAMISILSLNIIVISNIAIISIICSIIIIICNEISYKKQI